MVLKMGMDKNDGIQGIPQKLGQKLLHTKNRLTKQLKGGSQSKSINRSSDSWDCSSGWSNSMVALRTLQTGVHRNVDWAHCLGDCELTFKFQMIFNGVKLQKHGSDLTRTHPKRESESRVGFHCGLDPFLCRDITLPKPQKHANGPGATLGWQAGHYPPLQLRRWARVWSVKASHISARIPVAKHVHKPIGPK